MSSPELSIIEAKAQEPSGAAMDIKSLPYVFTLRVKLPAPGENQAQQEGTATVDAAAAPATGAAAEPAASEPQASEPAAAPVQKEARS